MFSFQDEFLSPDAERVATEALAVLNACATSTQAVEAAIAAEDRIKELVTSDDLDDDQARRLYLIFDSVLEIQLRKIGKTDLTPRKFP
jgi:hypothetical protein